MERIILDANVLFSNTLRSLFFWMLSQGICEIAWSREIWEEVFRNYSDDLEKENAFRQQIEGGVFIKFKDCMRELAPGYVTVGLPDPDDEHVVALARQEEVEMIVTFNLKDFPEGLLKQYQVKRRDPDSYLCELLGRKADPLIQSVLYQIRANHISKPKKSLYFESLKKAGADKFAEALDGMDKAGNLFPEVWQ